MDQLFPSEKARLVLGYLKEVCPEAATILEATSGHLNEYRLLTLENKNPKTTVYGMTLSNILDQHNAVITYIQNKLQKITQSQSISHSGDIIKNLETIIQTISQQNSDRNEVSVIYEHITQRQDSTENIKKIEKNMIENQNSIATVKNEEINIDKLTRDQESRLLATFRITPYLNYRERRDLANAMGVSEMVIKSWFQRRRNDSRDSRRRCTLPRDASDTDDTVFQPRPSTSRAADENEMNCSSSSQHKKHKRDH